MEKELKELQKARDKYIKEYKKLTGEEYAGKKEIVGEMDINPEADEIDGEDLDAAADYFDNLEEITEGTPGGNEDMKHVKLFERFITDSDVTRWEREHGKLPIPKEISVMAKDMLKAGFIKKDTTLTQAKLWIALEDVSWTEMEKKFGKLVGKFYGGEFYNEMTDVISIKAAYYAYEVSKSIQDKVANGEDVEPAYYELKAYFNAFGMDYNRSRIFNSAVSQLEEWMKSNKIETL